MSDDIRLSLNQNEIEHGYKFAGTQITVYSFEEALYHYYHYWRESQSDLLSSKFINWVVNSLDLPEISEEIKELREMQGLSKRYVKALSVTDYFSSEELRVLESEISMHESDLIAKDFKARGDIEFENGDIVKAIYFYEQSLMNDRDVKVYNNIGLAHAKLGSYSTAGEYYKKAFELDNKSKDIIFNYAEVLILMGDFQNAMILANALPSGEDKFYLEGKIHLHNDGPMKAINSFGNAHKLTDDDFYLYQIIDIYRRSKVYAMAMQYLDKIKNKNHKYLNILTSVLTESEGIEATIRYIESGIVKNPEDTTLLIELAKYYRLNKQYDKSEATINKVFSMGMSGENTLLLEESLLEKALINKEQGKLQDYQIVLKYILSHLTNEYRKMLA